MARKLSSREQLLREVQSVLSMRMPSDTQRTQSQQGIAAPGTPSKQVQPNHTNLTVHSNLDGCKDTSNLDNIAPAAADADDPTMHSSTNTSSMVGRAWVADVAKGEQQHSARCRKLKGAFKSFRQVIRAHPYIILVSFLTAAMLATAGVLGVLAAARTEERHRKDSATGFANNAAIAFEVQLQQTFAPLTALTAIIHFQPNYTLLAPRYNELAAELLARLPVPGAVASLQMSPQGVVRSFYPLKGNEAALNHNVFKDEARRAASIETVQRGELTMQGPVMLIQGFKGAIARIPVFMTNVSENETFGAPDVVYNCPPGVCYNAATRTKFWGFVSCIVKLDDLSSGEDTRLLQLTEMGYNYQFFAPQPDAAEPVMIAASPAPPVDPVFAAVDVPNGQWSLWVAPQQGWVPSWRNPMLATVIIVSVLFALLVMATLVSRHLQLWLLKEMENSNRALAAEKERMDVLLARQYNLISCMAQQGALSTSRANGVSSLEEKTLDQIESMRRSIGVASFSAGGDQLQMLELLGEGTFGKVYKGVWRGSTVAIKTMILPAKMSGAEKRERMAIMEAAISSTMNHPNIVQTYTYTIKPATSSSAPKSSTAVSDQAHSSASPRPGGGGSESLSNAVEAFDDSNSNVHSFEVNIVLEYCDWGCLRDALDAGAFYSDGSLNYSAILDTAADVAKAMLHLHCNQVIHSDLKVRNVLLKSDGSSERGCIAKVADFGLAVKMENQDTHVSAFQGTMSHMAPECMLRGHISKAADVYSFGITLWELYTGGHAYAGIPKALLGHQVAVNGLRPSFPYVTPYEYKSLAERCWQAEADKRPTFGEILATLQRLRSRVGGHTKPMAKVMPRTSLLLQREQDEVAAVLGAAPSAGSSTEQQRRVAAAEAAGVMQLASCTSYYVDMGSSMGPVGSAMSSDASASASGLLMAPIVQLQEHQLQQQQQQQHQGLGGVPVGPTGSYTRAGREKSASKLPPISDAHESAEDQSAAAGAGTDSDTAEAAAAADVECGVRQ